MRDSDDPAIERQAEELFHAAADLPTGERQRYLDNHAAPIEARRRAGALLAGMSGPDIVPGRHGPSIDEPIWADRAPELETPDLGPSFRLLRPLGEGGFGTVWLAEQLGPIRRRVAVKVIKPGMDTRQVVMRFRAERQALAMMDHAGIARVFEAGSTAQARPYFVMEFIEGRPLLRYCDEARLATEARLELFIKVCRAVEHAHQKGVIHRDLKPSNVLVATPEAGQTSEGPQPKIIDFGIAKAVGFSLNEATVATEAGGMIGTPVYMSPEQAEGKGDIDTRTDIYSMGVMLYELLCGGPPFEAPVAAPVGGNLADALRRKVIHFDPPRPSTRLRGMPDQGTSVARDRGTEPERLRRVLRGDLDWIVMKAMEKDRSRRYATVGELADDIRRHIEHKPVRAGPPGTWYTLAKAVRRNRGAFTAAALVLVAIVLGLTAAVAGLFQAQNERDRADLARAAAVSAGTEEKRQRSIADERAAEASRQLYVAAISAAVAGHAQNIAADVWRNLELAPKSLRGWEWRHLAYRAWPGSIEFRLPAGAVDPRCEPISGTDWALAAWSGEAPGASIWNSRTGESVRHLACTAVAVSIDGSVMAAVRPDGTLVGEDVRTGSERWRIAAPEGRVWSVAPGAFSLDGSVLAAWSGVSDRFDLISSSDGRVARTVKAPMEVSEAPEFIDIGDGRGASAVYFQSGDRRIPGSHKVILEIDSGRERACAPGLLLPDRRRVSVPQGLYDYAGGPAIEPPPMDRNAHYQAIAMTTDAGLAASGNHRGVIDLWSRRDGELRFRAEGSALAGDSPIRWLRYIDGGASLLATTANSVRVLPARASLGVRRIGPQHWDDGHAFSPDGRFVGRAEWGMVGVEDTQIGLPLWRRNLGRGWHCVQAWSPDGKRIAVASNGPSEFFLLDANDGTALVTLAAAPNVSDPRYPDAPPLWMDGRVNDMAFSPDGRTLLVAMDDGALSVVDTLTWKARPGTRVEACGEGTDVRAMLRFSPDGTHLLHILPDAKRPGTMHAVLRHASTLAILRSLGDGIDAGATGWSADSKWIAVGDQRGRVTLFDAATGAERWTSQACPGGWVTDIAWSPDGTRIAVCSGSSEGAVIDGASGQRVLMLPVEGPSAQAAWIDGGDTLCVVAGYRRMYRFESSSPRVGEDEVVHWPAGVPAPADIFQARAWASAASTLVDAASAKMTSTDERVALVGSVNAPREVRALASAWLRRLGLNVNYSNSACIEIGRNDLATVEERRGAAYLMQEASALRPDAVSLLVNTAWAQYRAAMFFEAVATVRRCDAMSQAMVRPTTPDARLRLIRGLCAAAVGDCDTASADLAAGIGLLQLEPDVDDPDLAALLRECARWR